MNWYTKRASLAAVYTSTELYMTQDVSPNSVDTLGFLQRRLQQAEFVGSGMKQVRKWWTHGLILMPMHDY